VISRWEIFMPGADDECISMTVFKDGNEEIK
jgi:hypothetical protein